MFPTTGKADWDTLAGMTPAESKSFIGIGLGSLVKMAQPEIGAPEITPVPTTPTPAPITPPANKAFTGGMSNLPFYGATPRYQPTPGQAPAAVNPKLQYFQGPQVPEALQGAWEGGITDAHNLSGRLPKLRADVNVAGGGSYVSPGRQEAYNKFMGERNKWLENRQALEQQWEGMGDAGAQQYHQQYGDYLDRQPMRGGENIEQLVKGMGYKDIPAYQKSKYQMAGQGQQGKSYQPQFQHAFGEAVDALGSQNAPKAIQSILAGEGVDAQTLTQLMQADPQLNTRVSDAIAGGGRVNPAVVKELLGNNPSPEQLEQLQQQSSNANIMNAVRSHYQPRMDAYNMISKSLGKFGAGSRGTEHPSGIPGLELYNKTLQEGWRAGEKPLDFSTRWESGGGFGAEGNPFQKAQDVVGLMRGKAQRDRNEPIDAANASVINQLLGTTPEHFDVNKMTQRYQATEGLSQAEALNKAMKDRNRLLDTRSTGQLVADTTQAGSKGLFKTLAALPAAPAAIYGDLTGSGTGEFGEKSRGALRDLASVALDPWEAASGFEAGGPGYLESFTRKGQNIMQANTDPQGVLSGLQGDAAAFAQLKKDFSQPGAMEATVRAAQQGDQKSIEALQNYATLGEHVGSGQAGALKQEAQSAQEAGPLGRVGNRALGSAYAAAPEALQWGSAAAMRAPGKLKDLWAGMGAWSAADPAFEATQGALDEAKVPFTEGKSLGDYQRQFADTAQEGLTPIIGEAGGQFAGDLIEAGPRSIPLVAGGMGLKGLAKQIGGKAPSAAPVIAGMGKGMQQLGTGAALGGPALGAINQSLAGPQPPRPPEALEPPNGAPGAPETEADAGQNPNIPGAGGQAQTSMDQFVNPEKASQLPPEEVSNAMKGAESLQSKAADPKMKAVMRTGMENLRTDPKAVEHGEATLNLQEQTGVTWEQATEQYSKMDDGTKGLLWLGLGVAAISTLSNIMDGGGGIMGWIMSMLGLGLAGGAAASGGMFGENAQGFMQDLMGNLTGGGEQAPQGPVEQPPALEAGAQSTFDTSLTGIRQDGITGDEANQMLGDPNMRSGLAAMSDEDLASTLNEITDPKLRAKLLQAGQYSGGWFDGQVTSGLKEIGLTDPREIDKFKRSAKILYQMSKNK